VLAQLILVKAKHRLEAFNKILPVTGVIASVISLIILAFLLITLSDATLLDDVMNKIYWFFGFLVFGLALWLLPMFSGDPQSYTLLGVATFLVLISQILIYEVIVIIQ
jgi:hypothetical protein